MDNKSNFVDTTTDQSIQIKLEKKPTPKKAFVIKTDKPLSKAEQQTNTEKVNMQQVEPNIDTNTKINRKDLNKLNSSVYSLNLRGMNIRLGKKEATLNKITEDMIKDRQQLKTESLNLFTDS